jgi:glycosyltransferase involved in cell wall biosynthesis
MRILMVSRCPPYPLRLGDRLIIYHLARELSRRGHSIDLLAFAERPEDFHEQEGYAAFFHEVRLLATPRRSWFDYMKRLLLPDARFPRRAEDAWAPQMWRAIQDQLARNRYDLIHLFGGIQVYEFRHALGDLPAIIVPYESYSLYLRRMVEASSSEPLPGAVGRGWRWGNLGNRLMWVTARRFESWMFTPYQRTVVVSQRDRQELLEINPHLEIDVIPNGIDLDYFQLQNVEREPTTLLFTGNFEYAPNVDAALRLARDILPQIHEHLPSVKLWLVGHAPPPELQSLQSGGSGLEPTVSPTVLVTGRVPDVRPYLARATAFICPPRLGAGIKNKVLEPWRWAPVVATLSVDGSMFVMATTP